MEGWTKICALEDIPRLGARVVKRSHGDIAVFRTADDAVFALADRCPHKGGPLSQGIVHGNKVSKAARSAIPPKSKGLKSI